MRILIADDHGILREGLKLQIEQQGWEVVGEATNEREAILLNRELKPDIIILDISMPEINGVEAAEKILDESDTKIIVLSMYSQKDFIVKMLHLGVQGYVLKTYFFDEILHAIESVSVGKKYLSPQVTEVVIDNVMHPSEEIIDHAHMSDRDMKIIKMLAENKTVKQIAIELNVSSKTIDARRRKIIEDLGFEGMGDLIKYAIRMGLTAIEN